MKSDNRPTARFAPVFIVYALCAALCVALVVVQRHRLADFGTFYSSGEAVKAGTNPYTPGQYTWWTTLKTFEGWNENLNAPTLLPWCEWLTRWDPFTAKAIWFALSLLMGAFTVMLLHWRYRVAAATAWALALGPFWDTLSIGQVYAALALFVAIAWLLLERKRDVAAGVIIGVLAALKPNLAVWCLVLAAGGYWRATIASVLAGLGVVLITLARYGWVPWAQWLDVVSHPNPGRTVAMINASVFGAMARFGVPALGPIAAIVLIVAACCWIWRTRPDRLGASAIGLVLSIVASPLGWPHFVLFLLPIAAHEWMHRTTFERIAAWLFLAPPVFIILLWDADSWPRAIVASAWFMLAYSGLAVMAWRMASRPESVTLATPLKADSVVNEQRY